MDELEFKNAAIKKMDVADLGEVLSIEAASSLSPWSGKMFIEELMNPLAHCFVIEHEGIPRQQIIGFICFRDIGGESELLNIAVHPQYRQAGMGKKLMEFYIDFCTQRQIKKFYLEVNASNLSAIHLYQSFSYQPVGVRKKFYQGDSDALLMVKKIC